MQTAAKTKKEVVTEFRTAEILAAAHRVFAEKGFHAATIDEVAKAANVAKGTVYLYYRSKDDLYWAALRRGVVEMIERTKASMDRVQSTEEKIHALIDTKVRYFDENREFFRIYYSEFGNVLTHPSEAKKDFTKLYLGHEKMVEEVLARGLRRKEIRCTHIESLAFTITELTRGLIIRRLLGWSKSEVEEDIGFLFDFVRKGIGRS
ncbi:MAG TPA: TetR/AcrR family transcriptional regulator [Terriglobia bacterium]|nr:TetR/AcrR family transcriptional regulator [Terriglobia bacterium]